VKKPIRRSAKSERTRRQIGDAAQIVRRDHKMSLTTPTSYDPETREADAVLSTGSAVRRRDWDGEYDEVLSMKPGSIRLARMNNGAQLLDSHDWGGGIDSVLGAVIPGSARIEGGKLVARLKFSNSERGQRVAADLRDGIPLLLSAGYKVHKVDIDDRSSPSVHTVQDWEPLEVSVVTVSAEEVGAGFRSHPNSNHRAGPENQGTTKMKLVKRANETDAQFQIRVAAWLKKNDPVEGETAEELQARALEAIEQIETRGGKRGGKKDNADEGDDADDEDSSDDADDDTSEEDGGDTTGNKKDKGRGKGKGRTGPETVDHGAKPGAFAAEILAIGRQAEMPMEMIERGLRECRTVLEFRERAFDFLVEKQGKSPTKGSQAGGADGGEGGNGETKVLDDGGLTGRAAAMSEALVVRMLSANRDPAIKTTEQRQWAETRGLIDLVGRSFQIIDGKAKPEVAQTRQYLGMSMVEIAAECIGYKARGLLTQRRAEEILTRAFQTTSDFPAIFQNALNKSLMARYQLAMPTYREISVQRNFKDFRPHIMARAGDFPMPQPLTEAGELRAGTSGDSKEQISVTPYGVIFPITRQIMVNDDMGAIDQILGAAGDSVLVFENTTFFVMFNSNPVLLTDNKNVFTTGAITVPPAAAVGHNNFKSGTADPPSVASIATARQSLRAMKSPSGFFLNIPPSIILTGPVQETAADQMISTITPALAGSVNPFSGKLRSISDANITGADWYVMADPARVPCFVYGFLDGNNGPRVRTEDPFGVQGLRVSLEHDFGCGAMDYRGAYRNAGV
jgi:hypothetical protein